MAGTKLISLLLLDPQSTAEVQAGAWKKPGSPDTDGEISSPTERLLMHCSFQRQKIELLSTGRDQMTTLANPLHLLHQESESQKANWALNAWHPVVGSRQAYHLVHSSLKSGSISKA